MKTADAKKLLAGLQARLKEAKHRGIPALSMDVGDLMWLAEAAAHTTLAAVPGDRVKVIIPSAFEDLPEGAEGVVVGYDLATHKVRFDVAGYPQVHRVCWGQVDILPKEGT